MSAMLYDKDCLVDVHLHVDGSISTKMARRLAALDGMDLDMDDEEIWRNLSAGKNCRDLNEYLSKFDFPFPLLQTYEQVRECFVMLEEDLSARGLIYAEMRFAPQRSCAKGLSQREVVEAAIEGLKASSFDGGIILCGMRGPDTHEANLETVRLTAEYLGDEVVACDLAGAEALFPTQDYEEMFFLARELGVPYTIHAGEAAGPESVWNALRFGARRLGHGIRSYEDPELMQYLAKEGIVCESCPTSNINTGIFASYEDFPYPAFREAGVPLSINADNMSVSDTDVRSELRAIAQTFALDNDDIEWLLFNTVDACFASEEKKAQLKAAIHAAREECDAA